MENKHYNIKSYEIGFTKSSPKVLSYYQFAQKRSYNDAIDQISV